MTATVVHIMRTYGVHGGERQLAQLFSTFAYEQFTNVFFFVYRDKVCADYFSKIKNLTFKTLLPFRSRAFPSLKMEMLILLLFLPFLQIRTIFLLRKMRCKVCVAHALQGALTSWLAAWLLRDIRFVYVHRGTKSKTGSHPLFKLLYRPFDIVAGVSKASAQSLVPLIYGRQPVVLENGIDWEAIEKSSVSITKSAKEKFIITGVGRLMPGKGQELILQAFALFQKKYLDTELWLIGDGPDRLRLQQIIYQLGIDAKVKLLGHSNQAVKVLAKSDVFVHASESEGLSNAVLEAMALELPSVVVEAPGVSECHIDKVTGFITSRDMSALADRFFLLAENESLRASMGRAAKDRVRTHYSIQANCQRYADLYALLLST